MRTKCLSVLGHAYKIRWVKKIEGGNIGDVQHHWCKQYGLIRICSTTTIDDQMWTLLHEILECVIYHAEISQLQGKPNHDQLSTLGTALFEILKDNDILDYGILE